jgi:hypothetical protein
MAIFFLNDRMSVEIVEDWAYLEFSKGGVTVHYGCPLEPGLCNSVQLSYDDTVRVFKEANFALEQKFLTQAEVEALLPLAHTRFLIDTAA